MLIYLLYSQSYLNTSTVIRSNLGGEVIRIKRKSGLAKQKVALKDNWKRTTLNGKFNEIIMLVKINKKYHSVAFI
jgi:hypothetical protein